MAYGALMLGVKSNPKHAICAHASLEPIIATIFAMLHPLYGSNDINKIISTHVKDARADETAWQKFAKFAHGAKMQYDGKVDLTNETAVASSLKGMLSSSASSNTTR